MYDILDAFPTRFLLDILKFLLAAHAVVSSGVFRDVGPLPKDIIKEVLKSPFEDEIGDLKKIIIEKKT